MDLMNLKNPVIYIIHSLLISTGFFLVWGGVFFGLASGKIRAVMSRLWFAMCPASLVSYLFFGTDLGDLNVSLMYFKKTGVLLAAEGGKRSCSTGYYRCSGGLVQAFPKGVRIHYHDACYSRSDNVCC
jgi:hypothetical protein